MPTIQPDLSYVLPIRQARLSAPLCQDIRQYLESIGPVCTEIIVVDGSDAAVFAGHEAAWGKICRHIRPDPSYRFLNGKVNGLLSGVDAASSDQIVAGDDDVRYTLDGLRRMSELLDRFDYVKPQNYFEPLPPHAKIDTARMLINRAVLRTGDYPGTCGFRKAVLARTGPYNGDVLFENDEMFRHFVAHGARMCCADDLFVARRPPSLKKFLEQRPRQSFEDLVMRKKTAVFASYLPLLLVLLMTNKARLAAAYLMAWNTSAVLLACAGRRKARGGCVFPLHTCLFAMPWILERGISVYVALFWQIARGGLPYWGTIVPQHGSGSTAQSQSC